jgi:tRNA/tmRNA/rRNA uracil-C5-methylase (TrmA/RlmC/RlmD family)
MTEPLIELTIDKVVAGGRALGRHDGRVALVWGAIPGERVRARVERIAKGVVYADTVDVIEASPDRCAPEGDWRCGGHVLAHVMPERQTALKADIIVDGFARLARHDITVPLTVVPSPSNGYRLRARLHVQDGVVGFLREGTHEVCPAGPTRQLLPATLEWLGRLQAVLRAHPHLPVTSVEVSENLDATERACHLELAAGADERVCEVCLDGALTGLSAQSAHRRRPVQVAGVPTVSDLWPVGETGTVLRLQRHVRAFFQGNRFLLPALLHHVCAAVATPVAVDLYAGVGLFGLWLASRGASVTLVEGDPVSAGDLETNAAVVANRVETRHESVERYLQIARPWSRDTTVIVDPPRTGLSTDVRTALISRRPSRLVYVSCDVATLARDARALFGAGYTLGQIRGFDLFPATAHVETVAVFDAA